MGHGDDVILCDTNFPADSVAKQTVHGKLLRIDGVSAARVAKAVLSVMPLDSFVDKPAGRMEIVRSEEHTSELQSQSNLVCRLLLEKKNKDRGVYTHHPVCQHPYDQCRNSHQ